MWIKFCGFCRDLWYYLTTRAAIELYGAILGVFLAYIVPGFIITTLGLIANDPDQHRYCNWEPKRGITKIYHTVETPARTFSCWFWLSKEDREPKFTLETDLLSELIKEKDYVSCDPGTKEKRKSD